MTPKSTFFVWTIWPAQSSTAEADEDEATAINVPSKQPANDPAFIFPPVPCTRQNRRYVSFPSLMPCPFESSQNPLLTEQLFEAVARSDQQNLISFSVREGCSGYPQRCCGSSVEMLLAQSTSPMGYVRSNRRNCQSASSSCGESRMAITTGFSRVFRQISKSNPDCNRCCMPKIQHLLHTCLATTTCQLGSYGIGTIERLSPPAAGT